MVEKWNIGYKKRFAAGGLMSDQYHFQKKIENIPSNPIFQYSIIPVTHDRLYS
jgi:hypothetical protein